MEALLGLAARYRRTEEGLKKIHDLLQRKQYDQAEQMIAAMLDWDQED